MGYMTNGLSFNTLRGGNVERVGQFKNRHGEKAHDKNDGSDWSPAQWLQATIGELGEYANIRKKHERGDLDAKEFYKLASEELADVVIYLDLLAEQLGINLGHAVMQKFNLKSREQNLPVVLTAEDWHRRLPTRLECGEDILADDPCRGIA